MAETLVFLEFVMGVRTMSEEVSEEKPATDKSGWGGRRAGSGKPRGSRNVKLRKYVEQALAEAETYLRTNDMEVFDGDSVALLISVYKNEKLPLNVRLQCAIAAAPYERPRLNAVAAFMSTVDNEAEDAQNTDWLMAALDRLDRASQNPETHISEIIPPEPPRPAFRKVEPVTIDAVAEDISALDDGISMGYEAEAASTHTQPHTSNTEKPAQASLWDDPAVAFGAPDGPYNPPVERVQVTRGRGGGIAYLVNGKLRE